jgi:hypothetical protein
MNRERPQWRKSSHSGNSGNCIEIAAQPGPAIAIRDSKDPDGARLSFMPHRWLRFTRRLQAGTLDLG